MNYTLNTSNYKTLRKTYKKMFEGQDYGKSCYTGHLQEDPQREMLINGALSIKKIAL